MYQIEVKNAIQKHKCMPEKTDFPDTAWNAWQYRTYVLQYEILWDLG